MDGPCKVSVVWDMVLVASRLTADRLARLVGHLPVTRAMFKV